jgi:hypothetical protein
MEKNLKNKKQIQDSTTNRMDKYIMICLCNRKCYGQLARRGTRAQGTRHEQSQKIATISKCFDNNEKYETHVAGKVRAATIAVVNVAGGGVVESSVEVVARALSVELARAVRNVWLSSGQVEIESLEELEHLVMIQNVTAGWSSSLNRIGPTLQPRGECVGRAGRRQNNASRLFVLAIRCAES